MEEKNELVVNETKDELVVYGENGEIVDCNFQRVDMDTPSTILSYCHDVRSEISNLLKSTSQMVQEKTEPEISEKSLKMVTSFSETLEQNDEKKENPGLLESAKKGAIKVLDKLGIKVFNEVLKEDTYASLYEEYCQELEDLSKIVVIQMENTSAAMKLKEAIIKKFKPLVKQLELMIEVGYKDKAAYDAETEQLQLNADPSNEVLAKEIQFRTQVSAIFNNKLNELEKACALYNGLIFTFKIQNNTNLELLLANAAYLDTSIPLLEAEGSAIVENHIQKIKLARQKALDEATNQAIIMQAKQLQMNTEAAVELSIQGRIGMSSIKAVQEAIQTAHSVITKGKEEKQKLNEKERAEIRKLNDSLNEMDSQFLTLIEENEVVTNALDNSHQKRLGGK